MLAAILILSSSLVSFFLVVKTFKYLNILTSSKTWLLTFRSCLRLSKFLITLMYSVLFAFSSNPDFLLHSLIVLIVLQFSLVIRMSAHHSVRVNFNISCCFLQNNCVHCILLCISPFCLKIVWQLSLNF